MKLGLYENSTLKRLLSASDHANVGGEVSRSPSNGLSRKKSGAVFAWDEEECMGLTGLEFGPDGHLYVACSDYDRIVTFDGTTGIYLSEYCGGNWTVLDHPGDIAFGPDDGLLYVVGLDNIVTCDGPQMTECVDDLPHGNFFTFAPGPVGCASN